LVRPVTPEEIEARRWGVPSSCHRKRRHRCWWDAEQQRRRMLNRGANSETLGVYACVYCLGYHLGNSKGDE
jgi:hypothetical protein